MHQSENKNQINHYNKQRRVLMANSTVYQSKSVHKETTIQDGDSQVSTTIDIDQRRGCLHRPDRCLPTCSDSSSIQEVPSVHVPKIRSSILRPYFLECP